MKKKINPEKLPPAKEEFFLHIKWSNYTALIMKSAFPSHPPTMLSSFSEITYSKCKKGRCGNQRCKCVNVGLLCWCNCIDCENHDRESDDEDTSDSEIGFNDSDSN